MFADTEKRIAFAHRLADAAGAVILPYFRKPIEVDGKPTRSGMFDPVTEADRRAEETMRKLIRDTFPDDAILGEEFGDMPGRTAYRWVLDPIDGTRAFVAGQPMWGTLIALEENGVPVFGLLDQPFLRERFIGLGKSAEMRDPQGVKPLKTRACAALSEAVVCTTHPMTHFSEEERARFHAVEERARLSRYGGDCYAYALVAMGFVDLVIETNLKRWDVAAILPIVDGAGGVVSDWSGNTITGGGNIIAAGDARVHAEAVKILSASGI